MSGSRDSGQARRMDDETMTTTIVGVLAAVFISAGVLLDRLWLKFAARQDPVDGPTNPLSDSLLEVEDEERVTLELIQKEWSGVLEVQMHFNDLVIRFRAMTLTAFGALVGAAVAIGQIANLSEGDRKIVLALPIAFWIAAGILDIGYYHRLLMGAVAQAAKFDDHPKFKERGLFGLTRNIQNTVRPFTTKALVILYYLVPLVMVGVLVLWRILREGLG